MENKAVANDAYNHGHTFSLLKFNVILAANEVKAILILHTTHLVRVCLMPKLLF